MKIEKISVGRLLANCYILKEGRMVWVIDPGAEAAKIIAYLQARKLSPNWILVTHGHFDHVGAVTALKKAFPQAKFILAKEDVPVLKESGLLAPLFNCPPMLRPPKPDSFFDSKATFGPLTLIRTPGHSPGGICFLYRRKGQPPMLFSGDTLFETCVGRYDFFLGSKKALRESLEKLFNLSPETEVYPGHGEKFLLAKASGFLPRILSRWAPEA